MKSLIAVALITATTGSIVWAASSPSGQPQRVTSDIDADEIEKTRRAFLDDELAPTIKPASYDVTIVEYTDYQCPFCRTAHDALLQLAAKDKKVRIIYRDWPIFGPQSERAARLAIASQWQGKHPRFHDALMKAPRPLTEEAIRAAARKAGLDWAKLEADLKERSADVNALLERNDQQTMLLGLEGTPGFIIGNKLYPGGMTFAALQEAVAEARKDKSRPMVPLTPEGI